MEQRPLILLANDDGVQARGLHALAERMADLGEVMVVAPDRERSATSHSFTLNRPLRVEEVRPGWFSVDGTPVDCVYIGLLKLVPRKPALLVSGINHGVNLGSDVFYSGTVACAVEAAIRSTPSMALSLEYRSGADFAPAAAFAHALARAILAEGLPEGTLLNVNVPPGVPRGYRWTRLGRRLYRDAVDERADLRGRSYYWIGGPSLGYGDEEGTDGHALGDGVVSVTPLDLDLTHSGLLERLPGWRLDGFEAVVATEQNRAEPHRPTAGGTTASPGSSGT
ncbi:MAG: 5'/3'-nucleotidase SurE [Myxococcales bacterium]|nr:5'/3'-nucleotidase SurE [Myxococcales bacterium]